MTQLTQAQKDSQTYKTVYDAVQFADGAHEAIEALLDKFDLERFLIWTAEVCREKVSHIGENWQDAGLARQWELSANSIDRVRMLMRVKLASGHQV